MNARFSNKKVPAALAQALEGNTVPVTVVKAKKRSKSVKVKPTFEGSVLVVG